MTNPDAAPADPLTADPEETLRYPAGRPAPVSDPGPEDRARWISEVAGLPARLRAAVAGLSDEQLDTPYRPGGWTVRQVVHHVADSHVNGYVRFCLALTEPHPTIRPYDQDAWSALPYPRSAPVDASLDLLEGLHRRWSAMLSQVEAGEWGRTYLHPENGVATLGDLLQVYAWHSRHHLAHVVGARLRNGW